MASVKIKNINKSFGTVRVLESINLDIEDGEFLILVGPSGCGKTTLLRIIAGLEYQDEGQIIIDDRSVDNQLPKQRNIAMVFQSYALYPHMTVAENIAVPENMRRLNAWQRLPVVGRFIPGTAAVKAEIQQNVIEVSKSLGIEHLLKRKPKQLSGGQSQRVALGRAIIRRPKAFLMDEPLSNLDAKLRVETRAELTQLHRRLRATFIYVTHDQTEALTMADRVAVIIGGQLLQVGTPKEVYGDPQRLDVAEFIGTPKINVLPGIANSKGLIESAQMVIPLKTNLASGEEIKMAIRPESLEVTDNSEEPQWRGKVRHIEYLGSSRLAYIGVQGLSQQIIITFNSNNLRFNINDLIGIRPIVNHIFLFDEKGRRIKPVIEQERDLKYE
jgi:multiple sugar transport system ATP-binding protein